MPVYVNVYTKVSMLGSLKLLDVTEAKIHTA